MSGGQGILFLLLGFQLSSPVANGARSPFRLPSAQGWRIPGPPAARNTNRAPTRPPSQLSRAGAASRR
jgi:hypothetical protein